MTTEPTAMEQATALARTQSAGRNWRDRFWQIVILVILIMAAAVSLFPLYWLFVTAITPASSTVKLPPELIPSNPTLDNITNLIALSGTGGLRVLGLEDVRMSRMLLWFINTLLLALVSTGIHVLFDTMAGYAFAKRKFPGSNLFFWMILAALMIPAQVTLVPLFLMITQFKLVNTFAGVMLPGLADVIGIFLLKQYIQTMPRELEEAARVDGASRYRMFAQVILPNAMPALTALAIFSFQGAWNAFLEPLIFISRPDLYTLPLGLAYFRQANYTEWPTMMAIAVITTVPMAIFYIIFQRWFIEGQVSSGIKG